MTGPTVEELLARCGQPVAGSTLSLPDMQRAVEEARVIEIGYWSQFAEGEADFDFATKFGIDAEGRVHATYIVFPEPIPPELRGRSAQTWEKPDHVSDAFGLKS